ncbi:MAG: hypothetical protein LQ338_007002 [Usnochroma carphineum]|nr:MAG: hypothetical protein LQ338_007002 [Usnochroma carphineum]
MAASGIATLTKLHTNLADEYDHPIKLLDTTKPKADPIQSPADGAESSGASLSRKWTRNSLRKELAKRKYAKWQQDKSQVGEDPGEADTAANQQGEETPQSSLEQPQDDSNSPTGLHNKRPPKPTAPSAPQKPDSLIDILYENQRGWFLFGMPLYSSASLLNFDPAPWQTSTFQPSPVNITNAQVPDPSWEWAWRTWYVDMSHDVDEEGWEYSFSFQARFAWHGSHPWFHSFARRRRWLRKRVKVKAARQGKGAVKEAHLLNADYFTIHGASRRDRSPDSSAGGTSGKRSSYLAYDGQDESEGDLDDVSNVVALLAVLKKATVDREKIVALRNFLAQGGEELHYLADNMDEIMGLLIYQTSRQQLMDNLTKSLDRAKEDVQQTSGSEEKEKDPEEQEAVNRRIDSLARAISAARAFLEGLDYWRGALDDSNNISTLTVAPAFGNDDMDGAEETIAHIQEANADNEIRGIPKDAEVDVAPSLLRTAQGQAEEGPAAGVVDKGKGKEKEKEKE